jgi:hypothetical protein
MNPANTHRPWWRVAFHRLLALLVLVAAGADIETLSNGQIIITGASGLAP